MRTMVANVKVHGCDVVPIRHHLVKKWCSDESCSTLSNVRRNLFGVCEEKDSEQQNVKGLGKSLEKEFRESALKASREWNFDFLKGVPLPGRYVWQQVTCHDAPIWYTATNRPALKNSNGKQGGDVNRGACFEPNEGKLAKHGSSKPRLVQTSMKDFTRVQKRRSSRRLKLKHLEPYRFRLRNHCNHLSLHRSCKAQC